MAIYEFRCLDEECGVVQEVVCPMSERPSSGVCPRCGGESEQVVLTAPGVLTGNMSNPPLDVVIGRDAAKRWDRIHDEKAVRDKVRRDTGKENLMVTPAGHYMPIERKLEFVGTPEPKGD